ncbi:putative barnase/colicin E5 family endoribonuclease, partial [Helicobacter trogontum]
TNLMKQDTQGLIPYNRAQDPKLLAGNEAKLLEYKQTLNTLQKLEKSFKDFMSLPFSIIVDSKGNALPLTSQAIKNFIFHNLYKEFMSATKTLNKPLAQLDFKPLSNEIKALPYKANANLKAHLRDINAKTNELLDSMQELKKSTKEIKLLAYHKPSENNANEVDRLSNVLDSKPLQHESFVRQDLRKRVWQEGEHYDHKNPKYYSYKFLDNKEIINMPDFVLSDSGKARKKVVAEEPKQRELIEQINAGQTEKFDEFIAKEKEAIQALGHHLGDKEGMQRFIDMANMFKDDKLKWQYLHRVVKDTEDIRYLMEETSPILEKAYRDVSKKLDSKIEAERAERKALKQAEKAAEIERIANYDLETAYKEKAHLEKIMQGNRNDYSPYSFGGAHNSEFLDKLDLVEQRIRDLKNKLPNKTPQENKPSKVEALKDFMDNARFQVNYAIKAKGTDTALKLIKQMIKDTNNTYEAKFLYRLKNEISSAKELPTKSNLEKDLTQQEIKETIDKWDLSPEANSKGKQRLMVSNVSQAEAEELNKHFNFKGKRDLTREIDSHQIIHTLKQHGDENIEKSRGQIAVNMDDISNYMDIIKNYDFKNIQDNGKIVYAKQINGHHVVLEEVLEGQDKIRFFDMWKQKGELNKEVLLSHSQRPNTSPSLNLERRMPNNTDNNTINTQTTQEGELYVHKRRNTSNDILNTSSHWDNMVSHRDDKMQDKYSIDTEGESTSRGEVEEFRGVGNKATHPQTTKEIRERNKGIARELKDIQKKTDNSRIIYNNGFKGGEVAGASDILESGGTTTKPSDLQITYPANHSSGKNPKADSTIKNTNELEKPTTKNYSLLRDDGFVKQQKKRILKNEQIAKEFNIYAERFEKEGDKQAVEDMQATAQEYKEIAQKLRENLSGIPEFEGYKPLSEFGTNYTEFIGDGKGAIQKLLEERQGQVAGAFYKEELEKLSGNGDIDLVWGEVTDAINHKGYGLAHILDKRKAEFIEKGFSNTEAEHKTLELIKKIPSVIDNGQIVDLKNGKIRIVTEDYTIGMKNEWHDNPTNPYILTTFENNKKSDKNLHSTAFTKGETLPLNSKEDSTIKNTNPIQNTATLHNPSIEFALQEFPEFSKAELEEMLTKGIRGEARTTEGFTKQHIEYIKDNTRYSGEIANYRDEELGMYGDTFHLANLYKKENAIDPTNWEASLKTLLDKAFILGKNKDTLQQAQDLMDSIHLNNPSFFTSLNPNYPKIKEILNEYQERLNTLIAQSPQDIKFIDTKGKEHTLSKDTQKQWLQTFGLQNLEQSYIPKHSQAIQQALGGKEIKLQKGSLLKLVSQGREQYIPQIKEVLDNPEAIIRDKVGDYLLLKHLKDDDYFVNVSFDNGEYLVSISNGFKETNNLQNKLKNGGEIIYQSPNANSILQTLLQTSRYSANTIDKDNSTTKNTTSQTKAQDIQKALELLTDEANKKDFIDKYYKPRFKHEPTDQDLQEIIQDFNKARTYILNKYNGQVKEQTPQVKEQGLSVKETKEGMHNPSIPTPQELQIQVDKVKAHIDELMKNPQIVDKQWLYRVNKPQEVETIQAHYFNQEIPQEYQEIIAPFPKLREQEIADTLKQHTQTQLKQAHKEQFLETFKDKPFKKTRIQASNLPNLAV